MNEFAFKRRFMLKITADALEDYIKGKDLNKPEILEKIYSEKSKVIFDIKPSTISFPSEISGNIEIAKVLSKDFNKRYEKVRTYYLENDSEEITSRCILKQRWLVVMIERETREVKIGTGFYDWYFEFPPSGNCEIEKHKITIGVMQSLSGENLSVLEDLYNSIPYPWVDRQCLVNTLEKHDILREVIDYLTPVNGKKPAPYSLPA